MIEDSLGMLVFGFLFSLIPMIFGISIAIFTKWRKTTWLLWFINAFCFVFFLYNYFEMIAVNELKISNANSEFVINELGLSMAVSKAFGIFILSSIFVSNFCGIALRNYKKEFSLIEIILSMILIFITIISVWWVFVTLIG